MQDEGTSYFNEAAQVTKSEQGIRWTASEFLDHQKTAGWYIKAILAILGIAVVAYVLTADIFTPIAVIVLGGLLLVAAQRKPRVVEYELDASGLMVNGKHFPFENFSAFSVAEEGAIESIVLLPTKRWAATVSLYFPPEEGQSIFELLGSYVPFEEHKTDAIDRFLKRIRF